MKTALSNDQFQEQFTGLRRSAFRLEQQPSYHVGAERALFDKFVAGILEPPTEAGFQDWYTQVRRHVDAGITYTRVRIYDEPVTDYQRWTRYMDRWNVEAGEVIHYLDRSRARAAGLTKAFNGADYWLFDDARVAVIKFDSAGRPTQTELITDEGEVMNARSWRDLAITTARKETE